MDSLEEFLIEKSIFDLPRLQENSGVGGFRLFGRFLKVFYRELFFKKCFRASLISEKVVRHENGRTLFFVLIVLKGI